MWANLFITGLRVLWKDRLYAAINLVGLAVALATATLIALWVRHELNWEPYLQDAERVRLVVGNVALPQLRSFRTWSGPANLAAAIDAALPGRSILARFAPGNAVVSVGDIRFNEELGFVDPNFFRIVTMPAVAGDVSSALDAPGGAVLAASTARKLFGTTDAIGRTIELDNRTTLRVTAIVADPPINSHFRQGLFVGATTSGSPLPRMEKRDAWGEYGAVTLMRLRPETGQNELTATLDRIADERYGQEDAATGMKHVFSALPLRTAQLVGLADFRGADRTTLSTIGVTGLVILALATVNFVSLATARSTRRIRETGIRKSVGAGRGQLVLLFLAEPVLLSLAAALLALVAVETSVGQVGAFLGAALDSPDLGGTWLVGFVVGLALLVGLLAGTYPALALSQIRPAAALTGAGLANGHRVRQVLVLLQFSLTIALIVSTMFVQRQTAFAREVNLQSIDGDPLLVLSKLSRLDTATRELLMMRLNASPLLHGAAATSLIQGDHKQSVVSRNDVVPDRRISYSNISVEGRFFAVQGQKFLAGRTFEDGRDEVAGSRVRAVFNQSAVRAFGFLSADAIVGQVFGRNSGDTEIEVIGVVPDMPLQSALEDTGPTIFYVAPSDFRHALIRVPGGAIREGIAEIDRIWNEVVPLQPVQREFADERIARLWRTMQIQAGVMTFFCSLAIVIGLLGLLGLAAFNAERRTKEIGVRKALGATTFDIAVLLTRQTLAPVVVANLIGWPLALWATMRFLSGFALHVEIGVGPFALAGLGTVLFTGAVVLLYAVARSRLQPANALRYE